MNIRYLLERYTKSLLRKRIILNVLLGCAAASAIAVTIILWRLAL